MPQNETTLFLHILITFIFIVSILAIYILLHNFLPIFQYIKLLFLLDRDIFLTFSNSFFLFLKFFLRLSEISFYTFPLFYFLNSSFVSLFFMIFHTKYRRALNLFFVSISH
jgi:hypothetical protein